MKISLNKFLPAQYKELIRLWRFETRKSGPEDRLLESEIRELGKSVREISRGLTGERIYASERYMNEPQFLGAYLLYYWPVSFAQFINVLNRLNFQPVKALDFGCGPGPLSLALALAGCKDITAVDRAKPALNLAKTLMEKQKVKFTTLQMNLEQPLKLPAQDYDLIVCGHVINELWKGDGDRFVKRAALLQNLLGCLKDSGRLVVLEPALMTTARELLSVRDLLISKGFHLEYPCVRQSACPCLESDKTTCHSEFAWELPQAVKNLAQQAGFDKSTVKTAALVFTKKNLNLKHSSCWRVVSERMLSKSGKLRFVVCGGAGRLSLSIKPAAEPSATEKIFRKLQRGDLIEFTGAEKRENGFELTAGSKLTIRNS